MIGRARAASPRLAFAAIAAAALAVASPARADGWEHPEFAAGKMRPGRIAIMPAQSEMVRTRVNEALPFVKETRLLEDSLRAEAADRLRAIGYQPDLETLSPGAIAADRDLQQLVRELEQKVGAIVDVAGGKPRDIGRGRFSVGEAVLPLASRTGAEGFLWLQSISVVPSKGQRTMGSIFSVLSGSYGVPTNVTRLIAYLVDGRTGDLAAVHVAQAGGPVLKEPERVAANIAGDLFRQWPSAGTARRVSEKRLAAAQSAVTPEVALAGQELDEAAIIARFEEAAARHEGRPTPGIPEDVASRTEFTNGGEAIAAKGAASAAPASLFEDGATPPPPSRAAAPAAVSGTGGGPDAVAMWNVAPAQRPAARRQVVLQMLDGGPGVTVRNAAPPDILVSVDLGAWTRLALGEQARFDVGPGSHRILVSSLDGVELTRSNVLVSSALASAEIWPP